MTRDLHWDGCVNVRDLGGLPTASGGTTRWRQVVRADAASRLTASGWEACRSYGISTVLDLRTREEREFEPVRKPAWLGARAFHAPIFAEDDPAWMTPMMETTPTSREQYEHILVGCARGFAAAAGHIASAVEGGVLVHCAAGRDRTGLLIAMVLEVAGVPREVIADDYAITANRLQDGNACRPETMLWALELLDHRFGGAGSYLRAGGLAQSDLQGLGRRIVGQGRPAAEAESPSLHELEPRGKWIAF